MKRTFALASASLALTACALLFDFDRYETTGGGATVGVQDAATLEATAEPDGDFDFLVPPDLTVTPGVPTTLEVVIRRGPGLARRVAVTVDPETLPNDMAWSAAGPIEPDEHTVELTLTVPIHLNLLETSIRIVGTAGTVSRSAMVHLAFRGPPCSLDRGFGIDGTSFVSFPKVPSGLVEIARTPTNGFAVLADLNGPREAWLYELNGALRWHAPVSSTSSRLAVDPSGAVLLGDAEGIRRYAAKDGTFDAALGLLSTPCLPGALTAAVPSIASVCASKGSFRGSLFDGNGITVPTSEALFLPQDETYPRALALMGRDVLACGAIKRDGVLHGAVARWREDGQLVPTFGVAGRLVRDEVGDWNACMADAAGIVVLGSTSSSLALFGLRDDGRPDPSFADGGVASLALPLSKENVEGPFVVIPDRDGVLAIVGAAPTRLLRFDRRGARDLSFADQGECNLSALGGGAVQGAVLTGADRLILVSRRGSSGTGVFSRVWL